jgi:glutamine synthetase
MHFADVLCVFDLQDNIIPRSPGYTGWWPSWEQGFGDMEAVLLHDTLRVIPWADRTAIVLVDFNDIHGRPLEAMPRNVLKRVVGMAESAGYTPIMTPEYEFTLLRETRESLEERDFRDPKPVSAQLSTYGVEMATRSEPLIACIRRGIEGLGIPIEASNAEGGPGQFELNLTPAHALMAADNAFLFKHAVRQIATDNGMIASFIAKMVPGGFGSSCHVHQSLQDSAGVNVFWSDSDSNHLSQVARQYIAGMVATMREFSAVFAPTINSYKRFEPEAAVGTTATWSIQSKAVGVRVVNESPRGCRVEHRAPGADSNPYLTLAAMLAGGIWGIEQGLDAGEPYKGNSYVDPAVEWIPRTLAEAVDLFEQSEVANKFFGEEAVNYFAATRRWEIEQFNSTVTNWELRRYLTSV